MPSSADRQRPDLFQLTPDSKTRDINITAHSLRQKGIRLALGLLILAAGNGLRPSPSQAADGELNQSSSQSIPEDIKGCNETTPNGALCYIPANDEPEPTLDQRQLFRRKILQGGSDVVDERVCPEDAITLPENLAQCVNKVTAVPVEGATVATLVNPDDETKKKFAGTLFPASEEPAPTPSPEPVAQTEPPIQSAPADCPSIDTPLAGQGLSNPRIARNDRIDWAKGTPLENITDVPKNSGTIYRFIDYSLRVGSKFRVSSFKCLGGAWRFSRSSEEHTVNNPSGGSWGFPFVIGNPEVIKGTWTALWELDDPNTSGVDFKPAVQQNYRIID